MKLKEASKSDYDFFYDLLRERDKKINISHKKMPTKKESYKFNLGKPYAYDFVILNKEKIGRVYLTKHNEIGIFIKKEYQNKHYGKKAILMLIDKVKLNKYYANVSPLNIRAQKFFKELRFKLIQYTYILE